MEIAEGGVHDGVRVRNTECRWRIVSNVIIIRLVGGDGFTQLIGGRTKLYGAMLGGRTEVSRDVRVRVKERESGGIGRRDGNLRCLPRTRVEWYGRWVAVIGGARCWDRWKWERCRWLDQTVESMGGVVWLC